MPTTKRPSDVGSTKPTKRPRSALHHTKNTAWDYAPQRRRSVSRQPRSPALGLGQGAFGSVIVPCEDDDVDEAAAALLAMSCPDTWPQEKPKKAPSLSPRKRFSLPRGAPPPAANFAEAPFTFPPVRMEVQSSVPSYPRLIISSKSNASDESSATNLDLKTVAGGSTESIQSTGLLNYQALENRPPQQEAPSAGGPVGSLARAASRDENPRSLARQPSSHPPYLPLGATISTGVSHSKHAPRDLQAFPDRPGNTAAKPGDARLLLHHPIKEANPPAPAPREAAPVQFALRPSPTSCASQCGIQQPAVRSRGGRLIVLPDISVSSQGYPGNPAAQQRPTHPGLPAPLVLAKTTQPRLQTSPAAAKGVPPTLERPMVVLPQPKLVTVKSEPRMAKPYTLDQGAIGHQEGSGEESSEEAWQPNWGLSLFKALNPNVITTGLGIAVQGRSTSQPLDAK